MCFQLLNYVFWTTFLSSDINLMNTLMGCYSNSDSPFSFLIMIPKSPNINIIKWGYTQSGFITK